MMAGKRLTGAISRRADASHAAPPQCSPPMLPGTTSVPPTLGGVKMPSLRSVLKVARHASSSSGVAPQRSASRTCCGTRLGGSVGNGCVARRSFTVDVARRDLAFLDRKERLARQPIEQEEMARLRPDGDGGPVLPRKEQRRRRDVVVPEVVVHGLEVPHDLAGGGAQDDDRVVVAAFRRLQRRSQPAEVIRAGAARRQQHQPVLVVDDDARPGVGGAGRRIVGKRMERPAQRSRSRVEGADFARRHPGAAVVGDERADDDEIAIDGGRRADAVLAVVLGRPPQALPQIDLAVLSESLTACAIAALEADEPGVDGADVTGDRRRAPGRDR